MKYNVKRHAVVQPLDHSIRLIPLTKGNTAIVDAVDYGWLSQWNWASTTNGINVYASRSIIVNGKRKPVYMHKEILNGLPEVDHRDGDGLNNRRSNLRPATRTQNSVNRRKQKNNHSGFKGVYRNHNNWMSRISVNKSDIYLGTFNTKVEAARAYDAAALKYFGEFSHINFPL